MHPDPHIILVFHRLYTFMSAIQYFPYTGILQSQGYSLHNKIHDHPTEYGEIQCMLSEMNHIIHFEIWPLFPSSALWTDFPTDYIKQIKIDRHIYEKRFTNSLDWPIHPNLEFNIFNLESVLWNPYWLSPVISNPQPGQLVYWQDFQDPYDLNEDLDLEDFIVNRLRQGLTNPKPSKSF